MVEKGSEFLENDERRYFKYRLVFQGNRVKVQNWATAMFNEKASRIADIYSCLDGHKIESRDV